MERTLKIVVSCVIGAWVGAKLAIQINQYNQWLWWTGLLVGGFIAYAVYEFKQVILVIPKAWEIAVTHRPRKKHWEPFIVRTKDFVFTTFIISLLIFSLACSLLPFVWFVAPGIEQQAIAIILFAGLSISIAFFTAATLIPEISSEKLREDRKKELRGFLRLSKKYNCILLYFYWLPKALIWTFKRLPVAARTIIQFIKIWFVLVHSRDRLLCMIDALIGGAIGFFCGSANIGLIAGGLFGLVNYEIISRRVLKVIATP